MPRLRTRSKLLSDQSLGTGILTQCVRPRLASSNGIEGTVVSLSVMIVARLDLCELGRNSTATFLLTNFVSERKMNYTFQGNTCQPWLLKMQIARCNGQFGTGKRVDDKPAGRS